MRLRARHLWRADGTSFKPALRDGKNAGCFAGDKLAIEVENAAITALALASFNAERGAEQAVAGFNGCRRNQKFTHRYGGNWGDSGAGRGVGQRRDKNLIH